MLNLMAALWNDYWHMIFLHGKGGTLVIGEHAWDRYVCEEPDSWPLQHSGENQAFLWKDECLHIVLKSYIL